MEPIEYFWNHFGCSGGLVELWNHLDNHYSCHEEGVIYGPLWVVLKPKGSSVWSHLRITSGVIWGALGASLEAPGRVQEASWNA